MRTTVCGLVISASLLNAAAPAQPADLRPAAGTGADRARALAELTDKFKNDKPAQAIAYGEDALRLLSEHPDPATEVRTLTELGWAYMIAGRQEQAVSAEMRAKAIAEQQHDRKGVARALNNLGVIAQRRGDGQEAADLFTASLDIYREQHDEASLAGALNNLGFVYSTQLADYEKALTYHVEALKVREALGDKASIALSLNNIGIVYSRLGQHARALDYFRQALDIRRSLPGQQNRIAAIVNNIGDEHLAAGHLEDALKSHEEALELRRQVGDKSGVAISLKNIGVVEAARKRYARATRALTEGLATAQQAGDRSTAALCLIGMASVHRQEGRAGQGVTDARRAVDIAQKIASPDLLRHAWEELSACQEGAGDLAGALASYKSFKETEDRIFNDEKARRLDQVGRQYQAERKEAEIERLRSRQARTEIESSRRQFQLDAVLGAALALGLVGFGLYRRRVESARLAAELSVTDALTGIRNRRYVQQTIGADLAACDRRLRNAGGQPTTDGDIVFILLDIDSFKSVNDTYGHGAGDAVLVEIAAVLKDACRASDSVIRWGGEEFLIIHRFTDRRIAPAIAERIRSAIETHEFQIGEDRMLRRTCSLGLASYPFSFEHPDALDWEQVVGVADQALYFAKRGGGNAWVGLSAAPTATPRDLQHRSVDDLVRAVAAGAILAQNSKAPLLAAREVVQQ